MMRGIERRSIFKDNKERENFIEGLAGLLSVKWDQASFLAFPSLSAKNSLMARKPRIEYPGALFHIIVRGNNRQDIFHDNEDRQNYLKHLSSYMSEGQITLYCFCLMTNHVHLLLEMGECPMPQVIQRLPTVPH